VQGRDLLARPARAFGSVLVPGCSIMDGVSQDQDATAQDAPRGPPRKLMHRLQKRGTGCSEIHPNRLGSLPQTKDVCATRRR
jgi:hypothetical protein